MSLTVNSSMLNLSFLDRKYRLTELFRQLKYDVLVNTTREGLRERKKRLLRQQLSDTATRMFIERGFDAVRVIEVAEACGVSDKTVFNYFPTKEALVLDRLEGTVASLRSGLAPGIPPVQAALRILDGELTAMTAMLAGHDDPAGAIGQVKRFGDLIHQTPSLRAYQSDMMEQSVAVAAEILAGRAQMSPQDPEPQIAARALLGLWHVQAASLRRHLDGSRTPARVHDAVAADVRRAARIIEPALNAWLALRSAAEGPGPARPSAGGRYTGQRHAPDAARRPGPAAPAQEEQS
jgi:AcrR family transcriptional regulator